MQGYPAAGFIDEASKKILLCGYHRWPIIILCIHES